MRYLKDIGFVIKRVNVGEADRYVTLFTKNHGKIELLARGVRKITSKRAPNIELLNLISFQSVRASKSYVLTEVELKNSFQDIKKNLKNISVAFLICELIDKLCPYQQKHEDIFFLIQGVIRRLKTEDTRRVIFDFQVKLLTTLGFWDQGRQFLGEEDLRNFIENVIERKIRAQELFNEL